MPTADSNINSKLRYPQIYKEPQWTLLIFFATQERVGTVKNDLTYTKGWVWWVTSFQFWNRYKDIKCRNERNSKPKTDSLGKKFKHNFKRADFSQILPDSLRWNRLTDYNGNEIIFITNCTLKSWQFYRRWMFFFYSFFLFHIKNRC